jgi:CBS domain-containing protein
MRAADLMTRDVVTVRPSTSVREAAALLTKRGCTSLPVLDDEQRVIAIVSEADLIKNRLPHDPRSWMARQPDDQPDPPSVVRDVMISPVTCMSSSTDAADLAAMMIENDIRAVPIVDGAHLIGIVSRRDLLRSLLRDDTAIADDARQRLDDFAGRAGQWDVDVKEGVVTVAGQFADDRELRVVEVLLRTISGVVRVHCKPRA